MIRRLFILLLLMPVIFRAEADTESKDTLMTASKANELRIRSDNSGVSITIKNLNGGDENFYYSTNAQDVTADTETTITQFKQIRDVNVIEIEGRKILVEFVNESSDSNTLFFDIPDPENRVVKSYIGHQYREFGINLSNNGKSQWSLISSGLGLGWISTLNSIPEMGTSMGKSLEWSWLMALGVSWNYGSHSVATGLGLDWRSYTIGNGRYFHKEDDGTIGLRPFDEGMIKGKSRLLVFSLQLPVLYGFRFGKGRKFGLTAGPVLNFNIGGNIKTRYELDSSKYEITTGKLHQSPVTVDMLAAFHWNGIGLYARYAPMKVLRSCTGLSFNSFSTGFMFFF